MQYKFWILILICLLLFWISLSDFDPCIFLLPSLLYIHLFIFSINNRTYCWYEVILLPWCHEHLKSFSTFEVLFHQNLRKLSESKEKKINVKRSKGELRWIIVSMSFARVLFLAESSRSQEIKTIMNQFPGLLASLYFKALFRLCLLHTTLNDITWIRVSQKLFQCFGTLIWWISP